MHRMFRYSYGQTLVIILMDEPAIIKNNMDEHDVNGIVVVY